MVQYRISRDSVFSAYWGIQTKRWWWPFWVEEIVLLDSFEQAEEMIKILQTHYTTNKKVKQDGR